MATGISITTSATNIGTFTGNDLSADTTPLSYLPSHGLATNVVISNNHGIDDVIPIVSEASFLRLPPNPIIRVSGAGTNINTLAGGWNGRVVDLIVQGASGFSFTGGNMCTAQAVTNQQRAMAIYDLNFACWGVRPYRAGASPV